MDNRYLALQHIVEYGSFSAAADELHCSQSAISQMISSLEKELGITLINRQRNGCTLTEESRQLYPLIERYVEDGLRIREKTAEILGLDTGVIRMGTIASISAHWLPGLISSFQQRYPNVRFTLHQGDYTTIQEWIHNGTIDFGFINPAASREVKTITIKQGEMLAVLPLDHPLAQLDCVPLKALAREPMILLEEGHYSEPLEAFASVGLKPNVRLRIHDDYSIMTMVEAGLGVSILAELILHRTNYRLALKPTDPPVQRTMAIAYADWNRLPLASRRFVEHIQRNIETLP
ncbi:LysR family transcriptional regulator [Bifidobacterium felsineum]|uniref:Transcriptional regulator n=1 Tax=Bifidobacterium felsineum TaxID=2045440 RepID=A0A2M9HK38_9BIFI|nr:LysR family transcriptional regulator [Bifidobacterium felsineum]MBT1165092.1 LysR family transcriptional regulator [Bifidobacterium felsineum]PJM77165.1 transcriptional regulator [Bifidobacterium felsineum]